jgi:hypothetical protein
MVTRVPLKLKDSASLQDFSSTEENYLAYQVGKYLISGDSSDVGSLTMDSSGTQFISGTFTDTAYDSAVGTGGIPGSFLSFSTISTTLRTNLGTLTPADSDYRIPVFREYDSDRGTITVGRPSSIPAGAAGYVTISNVSGDSMTIKIPSSRNKVFDTFCASSINIADSAVNGTAVAGGNISLGSNLHEPPKLSAPIVKGVTTGRYEDSDNAYVFNVDNLTISGTAYSSSEANIEYQAGDDGIYVDNVDQDIYQSKIRAYNDSDMTVLVDRLNSRIATSDYLGSYRLSSSAPSGDYTVNLANVMTDTRTDGSSTAYNIYQRTTQSAPTQVLPFAIKRSNGDSGDYQGLQLMTDRQIQQGLGLRARNRLGTTGDSAGTFIGNYKLLSSASGTPTNLGFSGTWAARGTATDTRQDIVDANYTRGRVSTYARLRESSFSRTDIATRSSSYSNDYSRSFSRQYTDTYTVNRESNYSVGFVGDYSRNYENTRSSSYTRTRQSTFNYTRNRASTFTGNYTRLVDYAGDFLGNYSRTSTVSTTDPQGNAPSGNFTVGGGNHIWFDNRFEAEHSIIQYVSTPGSMGAGSESVTVVNNGSTIYSNGYQSGGGFSSRTGTSFQSSSGGTFYWDDGNSSVAFSGGQNFQVGQYYGQNTEAVATGTRTYHYYALKYIGTITDSYVGNYTRTSTRQRASSISYSTNRASTFTGNYSRVVDYVGNYSTDFLGNYSRDFTRTTPDDFTRGFLGNYSRNFADDYARTYTRTRGSTYIGNYIGNYQGDFVGNYTGNFLGQLDGEGFNATSSGLVSNISPTAEWAQGFSGYKVGSNFLYRPNGTPEVKVDFYPTAGTFSGEKITFKLVDEVSPGTQGYETSHGAVNRICLEWYRDDVLQTAQGPDITVTVFWSFYGNYGGSMTGTNSSGSMIIGATRSGSSMATSGAIGMFITMNSQSNADYTSDYLRTSIRLFAGTYQREGSESYAGNYLGNYTTVSTGLRQSNWNYSDYGRNPLAPGGSDEAYWRVANNQIDIYLAPNSDPALQTYGAISGSNLYFGTNTANITTLYNDLQLGQWYDSYPTGLPYVATITRGTLRQTDAFGDKYYSINNSGSIGFLGNYAGTSYTRTSTRTVQNFEGNYSRNFLGNYSREFTTTRTSTYLGSDTFSRTFAGNYVGNYSRNFTRTFTGNYSRNFTGNYQGDYSNNYLGNYGRTFIGNYAGDTIGSGNTNIETYTLYVRTA